MSARIGLFYIIEPFLYETASLAVFYNNICIALRLPRDARDYYFSEVRLIPSAIESLVKESKWWRVYDILELLYRQLGDQGNKRLLADQINKLLIDEQLGFEMREGKIEKVGSGFIDANIKEARILLKEPEFKGADQLFEKAIKAINARPNPDVENCIKDSVAAIESVGKIISKDDKAKIDDVVKNATTQGVIPKLLAETIIKLYAYRGSEPAVAHGGVEPSKVKVDEAEFVLAMSAAMIIYLVKKRALLHQ